MGSTVALKHQAALVPLKLVEPVVKKQARCSSCMGWFTASRVARMSCPACFYQTSRCLGCGGEEGAVRSVLAHMTYWRVRGHQDGGHKDKLSDWVKDVLAQLRERRAAAQQ